MVAEKAPATRRRAAAKTPRARRPATKPATSAPPAGPPPWVGEWPRLEGVQKPRHEHSHDGDDTDSVRAAKFTKRVTGSRCLPWQWNTTRKMMLRRPDGLWTHRDVCLVCTRQQGKTWIMVARILFGLFFLGETIVYSAQRGQTADAVFERIKTIIEARPSLYGRLVSVTGGKQGRGDIVVHSKNGKLAHLRCGVRSTDLGRGLDQIDLVVFDEAYNLTEAEVSALTGAQIASPNAQTIYTSTAPVVSQHAFCHIFAGVRNRGRNGGDDAADLLYEEFAAPDPPKEERARMKARNDRENWRLASPSYGVISKERDVDAIRKVLCINAAGTALWEADYLGWGEWPDNEENREAVIPIEGVWRKLVDTQPVLVGQHTVSVTRTQDLNTWCIAVGRRTDTGRVQLELGVYEQATIGQIARKLLLVITQFDPAAIVIESHDPAAPLAPYMRKLGYDIVLTSTPQYALATSGFIDAAFSGDISHADQPILAEQLEHARLRKLPRGDRVWDDLESAITSVKAYTLAHWATLEFAEEDSPAALPSSGAGNSDATYSGDMPVELTF